MTKRKEHRKRKRFQVPKGVFVGIGPHFTKVGRLTDLSTDGLAFRYVGNSKPSSGSYADIFTLEGDRFFTNLQIKIVSDIEVSENGPPTSITIRRCSVKFEELTSPQKAELERFIKDHAIGEESA
jgi:c-di-GMP-binding flagellar brake protein YcgR